MIPYHEFNSQFRFPRFADPHTAMQDCRISHDWVTRELETATGQRVWLLTEERKRLARISVQLKAQY